MSCIPTAPIEYLVSECHRYGASIHLGGAVTAIDAGRGRIAPRCHAGAILEADAAILNRAASFLPEIMAARSTWDIASCNLRETSALVSS